MFLLIKGLNMRLISRFALILAFLLILLGIFIGLLPTIMSTEWGKRQTIALINHFIPGKIEAKKLHLQWRKGQAIEGFFLYDPYGNTVLGIEHFYTEGTLWQLLRKSTHLGHTQFQDLNASITTDEKGISNLQYALGTPPNAYYRANPPSTIVLSNVNADFYLFDPNQPFAMHITGATRQEELIGSFNIEASLKGLTSQSWNELSQDAEKLLSIEGSKEAKIKVKIINFPVDLLDRVVAVKKPELNGIFRAAFGDKLNLIADKEPSSDGLAFNLSLLAPLMQGDIKGKISKGQFSLQEPSTFHFNLAPQSINPLIQQRFQLLEETRLKLVFEDLSFPLAFLESKNIDPCAMGLKGYAEIQPVVIEVFPLGEIKVLELKTVLVSLACDKTLSLHVQGRAQQGHEPFNIQFDSTLKKPKNLADLLVEIKKSGESTLAIKHLPLELISPFLGRYADPVKHVLGSYGDINFMIKSNEAESVDIVASLQTDHLRLNQAQFQIGKEIASVKPFVVTCTIPPSAFPLLGQNLILEKPCTIAVAVKQINFPLTSLDTGKINAWITSEHVELTQQQWAHSLELRDFQIKIEGRPLSTITTQFSTEMAVLNQDRSYSPLLEGPAHLNISSHINMFTSTGIEISQIKSKLESSQATLNGEAKVLANQFVLTTPLELTYRLTPGSLHALHMIKKDSIKLQNSPVLSLKIEPCQLNLKDLDLASLNLVGSIHLDRLDLQDVAGHEASIEQIYIPWILDAPHNAINLDLKGIARTSQATKPSQLSARLLIQQWLNQGTYDVSHLKVETMAHLVSIPTAVVNPFITKGDLSVLLGPTLDIELKTLIDRDQQAPGYWDMNIDSAHFHAKARLKFEEAITLYESINHSADIRWTLTPEGYQQLKSIFSPSSLEGLTLLEPLIFKGTISQLYLPLKNESWLQEGKLNAVLTTNEAKWRDSADPKNIQSFKMEAYIQSPNLLDQIDFKFKLDTKEQSTLSLEGAISRLFDLTGQSQLEKAKANVNLTVQNFPLNLIHSLFFLEPSSKKKWQALLGDFIDGQGHIQLHELNGLITANMRGSRGDVSLDGQLQKGILTLNHPLQWNIKVTPELSQAFLTESLPLFSTAFAAEESIKFTIEPTGFSLSLIPLEFKAIQIQQGSLKLGKIRFRNEGELRAVLNLLKPIPQNQFTIWFTPLYFQIEQGKFLAKRVDMLVAHEYSLASWGEFDLYSRQLNMIIGLSSQSLKYGFNISGLDSNYLLQIPITGRDGSLQIDKKKAVARISALAAQAQGSKEGKLLGKLLDVVTSDNQDPWPPSPTTTPFPWQDQLTEDPLAEQSVNEEPIHSHARQKKKSHKKEILKEIEEGAASFLRDLLNQKD